MTWTAPGAERAEPPYLAGERVRLDAWLDYHRATLLQKCAGLPAEQLAIRPVASSGLSLLGLVRHMAGNERIWFRIRFGHAAVEDLYQSPDYPGDDTVTVDLRWLYAHMIDEYARHNGHADLIRELVDGATGL